MINKKMIIARLKEIKGKKSVRAFAINCGIPPPTMQGYFSGVSNPKAEIMRKIAEACGVSVGWLVAGEGDKYQATNQEIGVGVGENSAEMRLIIEAGRRATQRNFHLRKIVEWMDEQYADENQCLGFFKAMENDWLSFKKFVNRTAPPPRPDRGRDEPEAEEIKKVVNYRRGGE